METINMFLQVCGGVSIVGGALAVLWKMVNPAFSYKKRIDEMETKVEQDNQSIKELKEMQIALCKAQIAMIDHELTGNHVDGLKEVKSNLINELAKIGS